jgi:1L-myo-inositol 1-phosphate cytidylyltransferase
MDAVILAAGFGSRLRAISASKPLTPVSGTPLLELGVHQAVRAGATRVVVVTGHAADEVEAALPAIGEKIGAVVEARRVADWTRPNGYSVIAGASVVAGPFLLMMADHIFSDGILDRLADSAADDRGVTLAVDRRIGSPLVDPGDATWVRTGPKGFIRAIGKDLSDFDAVDCGAFLATSELPAAIAAAIRSGRPGSLSDGMQILADAGRAATIDIGEAWWIDVDDPRAHALAEAQIAAHLHCVR